MTLKSSLCKHLPSVRSPSLRCHHRYEYHGADHSLLYKFVLSPLAQASLALVPSWMAPNLVTAIGLGLTTACYALIYFTAPGMISVDTPAWVFITAALGVFLYQTLDNIDGKQARRTESSSPLGLLFDHGCDAINCCFGVVFAASIVNAGTSLPLLGALVLNQLVPFFFTTWEHYHTHKLVLPIVNGPSEGVIIGVVLALLRGVFGPEFFATPRKVLLGCPLGVLFVAASLLGVGLTLIKQIVTVALSSRRQVKDTASPMSDCLGFVALMIIGAVWSWMRPSLFHSMPYTMVLLFGLVHIDMAVHVMVCHICDVKCKPFRPILIPFLLVVGNSCFPGGPLIAETWVVWIFTLIAAMYEALYLYLVVAETSKALDIFVFKLGKRSQEPVFEMDDLDGDSHMLSWKTRMKIKATRFAWKAKQALD
ncbi:unnamed protein product [Ascophyllum nodosum]